MRDHLTNQIKITCNKMLGKIMDNAVFASSCANSRRVTVQQEYLNILDEVLNLGIIERVCYAALSSFANGEGREDALRELQRANCMHCIKCFPDLMIAHDKLVCEPDSMSLWLDFLQEAGTLMAEKTARKLALYAVLDANWQGETIIDKCYKIFNKKKKFFEGQ